MSINDLECTIAELTNEDRAKIFNYIQELYCLDCGKVLQECICLDE